MEQKVEGKNGSESQSDCIQSARKAALKKPVGQISPSQAIRRHCRECCDGQTSEVERCQAPKCILWPWRFGRRPDIAEAAGKLTDPSKFVPQGLKGRR